METNTKLVSSIVSFGRRYCEEFLGGEDPNKLLNQPWFALRFFFGRACFQGRRDEISQKVFEATIATLSRYFENESFAQRYQELKHQKWKPVESELQKRIGKGKVGKARDIDMVLSTLDFIGQIKDLNIVASSVEQICAGKTTLHCKALQRSLSETGIISVGPKIAALYLRDVVSLFELEDKVPAESLYCLQPVDVWVRKLANKIQITDKHGDDLHIQKAFVALCQSQGVSPILFNQGAWYVGYKSFDIVLELLGG